MQGLLKKPLLQPDALRRGKNTADRLSIVNGLWRAYLRKSVVDVREDAYRALFQQTLHFSRTFLVHQGRIPTFRSCRIRNIEGLTDPEA